MTTNQDPILFPVIGTSKITSTYGIRVAPISGISSSNHVGIDIAAARGSDIQSIQSGTVVYSGTSGSVGNGLPGKGEGYGNVLVIKNSDGTSWLYAHLDNNSINFSKGDSVNIGNVIAGVGATGSATGYHLHIQKLNAEATALIESNTLTNKLGASSSYIQKNSLNPTQELIDAKNNLNPTTSSSTFGNYPLTHK